MLVYHVKHFLSMSVALHDFSHVRDPFFDAREALLEAFDFGQGKSIRDLIVVDDVNDSGLAGRNEELTVL